MKNKFIPLLSLIAVLTFVYGIKEVWASGCGNTKATSYLYKKTCMNCATGVPKANGSYCLALEELHGYKIFCDCGDSLQCQTGTTQIICDVRTYNSGGIECLNGSCLVNLAEFTIVSNSVHLVSIDQLCDYN